MDTEWIIPTLVTLSVLTKSDISTKESTQKTDNFHFSQDTIIFLSLPLYVTKKSY